MHARYRHRPPLALKNILTNKHIDLKSKSKNQISNEKNLLATYLDILLYCCKSRCLWKDLFNHPVISLPSSMRSTTTTSQITIAHSVRHLALPDSLLKRLAIVSFDTYYNRQLLQWTAHVAGMPFAKAPRKTFDRWVENSRPLVCPQLNWAAPSKRHFSVMAYN
jgi:hypothetical protein